MYLAQKDVQWWLCLSPLTLWVRTPLRWGVLNTTICDKVCQWLVVGPINSGIPTEWILIILKFSSLL
jgi:hypothetical protein